MIGIVWLARFSVVAVIAFKSIERANASLLKFADVVANVIARFELEMMFDRAKRGVR